MVLYHKCLCAPIFLTYFWWSRWCDIQFPKWFGLMLFHKVFALIVLRSQMVVLTKISGVGVDDLMLASHYHYLQKNQIWEIHFPRFIKLRLSDWGHQGFICFLKFHNVFAQKPLLYFISRHMSINSCWWNVSASALERVLFSFPPWIGICRDSLIKQKLKNLPR